MNFEVVNISMILKWNDKFLKLWNVLMIPLVSPQNGGDNNNDHKYGHGHSDDQGIVSLQKSNITLLYKSAIQWQKCSLLKKGIPPKKQKHNKIL